MPTSVQVMWVRAGGWLVMAAFASACASSGAVPRPFPMREGAPPVPAAESVRASADSYALVGTALSLRGAPYRNGGTDPSGFDCSGFTQYVYAQHGVALPRDVREQFRQGTSVDSAEIAAGDLVFFATTEPSASHVAIAIGGDEFVHAPSSTGVVRVEHLNARYWAQRFVGARRLN
jgi:cell wall-associated NlpC family hydrolase